MARPLQWSDVRAIAEALEEAHPDADAVNLRFTDLRRWVIELPGFAGDPKSSNEKVLEAIQMAWLDERDGPTTS
jgi:FeS assembly protein IscX